MCYVLCLKHRITYNIVLRHSGLRAAPLDLVPSVNFVLIDGHAMLTWFDSTAHVCPFPGCGRAFSVSSNMRRHHRGHARQMAPAALPGTASGVVDAYQGRVLGVAATTAAEQYAAASASQEGHRTYSSPRTADSRVCDVLSTASSPHSHSRTSSMGSGSGLGSGSGSVKRQYPPTPPYSVGSPASQASEIVEVEERDAPAFGAGPGEPHPAKQAIDRTHRRHPRGSLSDILGPSDADEFVRLQSRSASASSSTGSRVDRREDHPSASASAMRRSVGDTLDLRQQPSPDTPSMSALFRGLPPS